jgi:hypothetical protein
VSKIGPTIPEIEGVKDDQVTRILKPMKQVVDLLAGRTPHKQNIVKLGPTATLGGVITKVNEIIDRLQQ